MTYIGYGVYADFDGYQIKLCANSHTDPTDTIYLDPYVMEGIRRFIIECQDKMRSKIYTTPAKDWTTYLADAIDEAAQEGDIIQVRNEAMKELGELALARMHPTKKIQFIVMSEEECLKSM